MKYSNRHISDDELDQLFRDAHASEGPEALFVPEFWSDMEAMLPAEKKKRRGLYWIPLAAAVVVMTTLIFYPQSPVEITAMKQQVASESANRTNPEQTAAQPANNPETQIQTTTPLVPTTAAGPGARVGNRTHTRINTVQRVTPDEDPALRVVYLAPVPVDGENAPVEIINDAAPVTNQDSELISSVADLDSVQLEPRNEQIIHDEVAGLPKKMQRESNEWYVELGPTLGQSPYLSQKHKRNAVAGVVLGGGYSKRIENASVSLGLQMRMEGFGGLNYRESNFSQDIVRTVSVKQLYSLEMPLKLTYHFKRCELAFGVVPGVQLFLHGKETITQNQVVKRQDSYTGKVEHSNSLTMEFGFQYYYNLSPSYSIGAKFNADILRPFHTDYYMGKLAGLPVNGQIVLRRTFTR